MQQVLWHDTITDALSASVQAAGGVKKVGGKLWPALGEEKASTKLRACLNPDHAQKFDEDERLMVMRLARDAGNNAVMDFLGRELGYEVTVIEPIEAKKRAKRAARLELLDKLKKLEDDE